MLNFTHGNFTSMLLLLLLLLLLLWCSQVRVQCHVLRYHSVTWPVTVLHRIGATISFSFLCTISKTGFLSHSIFLLYINI